MKSGYFYTDIDGTYVKHWKNGSTYTLTASPKSGYRFVCWKKGSTQISTDAETDVIIDGNATYTAYFEVLGGAQYTVTTAVNNNSLGSVTPIGYQYENTNWNVTVTINDPANYYLSDWLRDGVSMGVRSNPLPVTVTKNEAYTAVITAKEWTLTVNSDNTTYGTASGSGKYYNGENTTIVATPANSFTSFVKWQKNGVDIAGGASLNITVNANDTYTAFFSGRNVIDVDINASYTDRMAIYSLRGYSADNKYYVDAAFNASTDNLDAVDGITYNGSSMSFTNNVMEGIDQPCGNRVITHLCCYNATGDVYHFAIHWHFPWSGDTNDGFDGGTINTNMMVKYNSTYNAIEVYGYTEVEEWNSTYTYRALDLLFVTGQRCSDAIKLPEGVYPIDCSNEPGTVMSWQSGMGAEYSYAWSQTQNVDHGNKLLDKGTVTVTKSGSNYTIVLNGKNSYNRDMTATMTFNESIISGTIPNYTLTVNTDGHGTASVKRYDCNGDLNAVSNSGSYKQGSYFRLEATPSSGYVFDYWTMTGSSEHFDENPIELEGLYDNATITAHFVEGATTYALSWDANGGALVGTAGVDYTPDGNYEEGTSIIVPHATREGYHLTEWDGDAVNSYAPDDCGTEQEKLGDDEEYVARWAANTHNVSWVTDGNALTGTYTNGTTAYGTTIVAPNTPTKNATAEYTYAFDAWSPTPAATMPDNDVTYTATWTQTPVSYTLTWTTDGDALTGDYTHGTVAYGTTIAQPATPTKTGYTFAGWDVTPASTMPAANTTYTATWTANQHNISWVTDGNALTGEYTSGTTAYGTTIVAPNTPTKNATAEYTYAFDAWSPTPAATMPDNDVEYTATWTQTPVNYTLTWDFAGGATATAEANYTHGTVAYGTTIVAPANPTRSGYTFMGWSSDVVSTMPAANTTYTATWAEGECVTLLDNENDTWYDNFKTNHDGKTVTALYSRTFTQGRWSTLCLPFDVNRSMMMTQKLNGSVYEFKYATGDANVGDNVMLYFAKANTMEAGKCYIVNANSTLAAKTSFTFSNVTFNLANDLEEHLTSASAYDNLPETKTQGTIGLVGTLRKGTLIGTATGNTYMGLKNNKIWYPNPSVGNVILAYRGLFRSTEALNAGRVRIVVEGETVTELEVVNGEMVEATEAKKFVQDGILYIERDGVIYNAQGQKVN